MAFSIALFFIVMDKLVTASKKQHENLSPKVSAHTIDEFVWRKLELLAEH